MDKQFSFLDKVSVTNRLARMSNYSTVYGVGRDWVPVKSVFTGTVIGKRTLSNGYRWCDSDGCRYEPAVYFTAYLVVENMNSNPVYVLAEDMEHQK